MKLSVVIPTLNEEDHILRTLRLIRERAKENVEILVVDAGSGDGTVEKLLIQSNERFHVDDSLCGRKYESLNVGAHLTGGEVILFLDADTIPPFHFDKLIDEAISKGAIGGAFNMKFDTSPFPLGIIRFVNSVRYGLTKRYFGDQGLFCTREVFLKSGGYPEVYALEASRFCKHLKAFGKLSLISAPVITSSRRFVNGGILRVFWMDCVLYFKDLAGISVEEGGKKYWEVNAKASPSLVDKS